MLKDPSSLNYPKKYCNDCHNKQDVDKAANTIADKADQPENDQYDRNKIK